MGVLRDAQRPAGAHLPLAVTPCMSTIGERVFSGTSVRMEDHGPD